MEKQEGTVSSFIKKLNFIYLAILFGPIAFGTTFYLLSQNLEQGFYLTREITLIVIPIIAISGILFGNQLFKKMIAEIPKDTSLNQKMNKFRTAFIIKLSLIESPALASTFIYYTTLNLSYLMIAGALILYMISLVPKKEKIATSLDLSNKEKARFNQLTKPME